MIIYSQDKVTSGKFKQNGIGMTLMSKIFIDISDNSKLKTLNDLMGFSLVVIPQGHFKDVDINTVLYQNSLNKKVSFALVKSHNTFSIETEQTKYFARIQNGVLNIENTIKSLEDSIEIIDTTNFSNEEKQAFDWLEHGETGISSKTLCHHLYPNVNHWSYENMSESYPHDVDDFIRCQKFLNAVDGSKEKISIMKQVNPIWKELAENWYEIAEHIKKEDFDTAYDLIKHSINHKHAARSKM